MSHPPLIRATPVAAMLTAAVNIAVFAAFSHSFRPSIRLDCRIQAGLRDFGNLTFRVMGDKNGKKRQRGGNGWQGRRQKRQHFVEVIHAPALASAAERWRVVCRGHAVVQGASGAGWRREDGTKIP